MKFILKFIATRYKTIHHAGRRHIVRRPYLLPVFGLLLGVVIVAVIYFGNGGYTYTASDSHVVFVFDSGHKTT
ncbi:MAG TPA: hypothetical protein VFW90_00885, partial [Candidatus Saccharimonadales bacterium]|nr:hypothetical protein [Candidatus Saccharimonadales bacterium]